MKLPASSGSPRKLGPEAARARMVVLARAVPSRFAEAAISLAEADSEPSVEAGTSSPSLTHAPVTVWTGGAARDRVVPSCKSESELSCGCIRKG